MTSLEKIRAKCIEVNPDILEHHEFPPDLILARPIRLTDVLLAMNYTYLVGPRGAIYKWSHMDNPPEWTGRTWDLTKDLDGQNEETLTFISSILDV